MNLEAMSKWDRSYVPHMTIRESSVTAGGEWRLKLPGWALVQVAAGSGYWLGPQMNQELETGTVLLVSAQVRGIIRASSLGGLRLQVFPVEPARLTGLITMSEQRFLEGAAVQGEFSQRIFSPGSPIATKMKELCAGGSRSGSLLRLQLLQLFIEVFDDGMQQHPPEPAVSLDAKQRLQNFLRQTPTSELLYMSYAELAQMARCTPRHLNRIFQEVVGMSFRDKRTELRLARACELLATTESKVVDVALESGYESLSLFNLMFARRFGTSPGRWRQTRCLNKTKPSGRSRSKRGRMVFG
jgi:AraC-like DNA-binding protein